MYPGFWAKEKLNRKRKRKKEGIFFFTCIVSSWIYEDLKLFLY